MSFSSSDSSLSLSLSLLLLLLLLLLLGFSRRLAIGSHCRPCFFPHPRLQFNLQLLGTA